MKRNTPPVTSLPATTPRQAHPASTQSPSDEQQVVTTVTRYITALKESNYGEAYKLLSASSKNRHNISDFEQQGKKGMPLFDLSPKQVSVDGDTAIVELPLTEDPATHPFHLVREDKAWKVVYQGGVPGNPYPKGGNRESPDENNTH